MRAVVQRVKEAKVEVEGKIVAKINKGLLVLLGVGKDDTEDDIKWMANKIMGLRIFEDENNKMNLSILDIDGELLVVSQFTLYGDVRRGKRPSFTNAASSEKGEDFYEKFVEYIRKTYNNVKIETGIFGAMMNVHLINWGPVTILIDSKKTF
ncbi:MAG: D-tyrosyl-tRNA(Tyr) deacylase [Thermotogaceae bacterium]|nr:D-tyrosyl-tRNA(Tyr) deacylase [Thermotogaceae bacterium]